MFNSYFYKYNTSQIVVLSKFNCVEVLLPGEKVYDQIVMVIIIICKLPRVEPN